MKSSYRMKLLCELGKDSQGYKGKGKSTDEEREGTVNLRKSILIIDDEPALVESLSDFLSYGGYNPIAALSAKEGIAKLHRYTDISLIVCDLVMPEDDGFVMLKYLRSNLRFREIPVLVSSSVNDKDVIDKALAFGVRGYLVKPYTSKLFLARIQETLDSGLGTILVVTENFTSTRFLVLAISRIGYRLLSAENGKKALEVLAQEPVNGVLSELALTDMTGLNLMVQAQEVQNGVPFMFIDDPQLGVTESDVIAAGGRAILRRPFNNIEVARKIAHLVFDKRPLSDPSD